MKSIGVLLAACVLSACSSGQQNQASTVAWSYSGPGGPEQWASLSEDFAACGGDQQSPINLTNPINADVENITTAWKTFRPEITNTGYAIRADAPAGSTSSFGGETFNLLQVHWHRPSDHTVGGMHAPLEGHFVHQNPKTQDLMVLGVLMTQGPADPQLQTILDAAPRTKGTAKAKADMTWQAMLPADPTVYRYAGSLTTPPCAEIVSWVVYKTPMTVSKAQLDAFAQLTPEENSRPLQPTNRRFLLTGK